MSVVLYCSMCVRLLISVQFLGGFFYQAVVSLRRLGNFLYQDELKPDNVERLPHSTGVASQTPVTISNTVASLAQTPEAGETDTSLIFSPGDK